MTTLKLFGFIAAALLLSLALALFLSLFLPFPTFRIFYRSLTIFGLIGAYLFRTRVQKKSFPSLGLERRGNSSSLVWNGIAFALLSLLILTLLAYLFQAVSLEYHPPKPKKLFYYTLSAFFVGFFEELFFRGLLLQTLMEDFPAKLGVVVSSLVYSLLHFVRPLVLNKPEDLNLFFTESIGLFLFGVLMSYAYLRTRSLYLGMGMHGGFVWFMKMDNLFVNRLMVKGWLFGEERLIGGIVTWLLLLAAFPWIRWINQRYLPIQNCEKIRPSRSSVKTSPTISPRA